MQPIQIALYHNLPSGGAKRHTFEQVRRLAQREHSIYEFALSTADLSFMPLEPYTQAQYIYEGHSIRWFKGRLPFLTPYVHALQGALYQLALDRQASGIARRIDRMGFDVVFAHDCQLTTIPFVLRHLATPTVFYIHSLPLSRQPTRPVTVGQSFVEKLKYFYYAPARASHGIRMHRIDQANLKAASAILANSHFTARWLAQRYGVHARVVYPGVDVDKFRPLGLARDNFVLAVGSLTGGKGYRFIVTALGRIDPRYRPELIIAANFRDPEEEKAVTELAAWQQVPLRIETIYDDKAMVSLYNRAQMLLFAPYNEPLGLVALEAMACGTPVVGIGEGGLCETIIDRETGLLVKRDPQAFADAIAWMLAHPFERDRLGKAGIEHVRAQWTWGRAVDALEEVFAEVLKSANGRPA